MEKTANRIEEKFIKKLAVYRDLADILEKESEILKSADPAELWRMSGLKHEATLKIESLRKELVSELDSISPNHGIAAAKFSCSKVMELVPKETAEKLAPICVDIERFKKAVFELSVANVKFTEEYLHVIEQLVAVFADAAGGTGGYMNRGNSGNVSGAIFRARV